jgi:phosphoserine aminotransferase
MDIDYTKIDAVCWSWQKALGGEGGHGMIALSPRAIDRLRSERSPRVSKLMRLHKLDGSINRPFFSGYTISTPSMFAVADVNSALDWVESLGGLSGVLNRVYKNYTVMEEWVEKTKWIDWVASNPTSRSTCSICLCFSDDNCNPARSQDLRLMADKISALLESENAAFDISSYGNAPPGFRIWAGPTVEHADLRLLCDWLDWAYSICALGRRTKSI